MSLESDLIAYLALDGPLSALVGARIYPGTMETGAALPAIVYTRVSTPRTYTHSGRDTRSRIRMQFDCWATTHVGVIDVAETLVAALEAVSSYGLGNVFIEEERDMPQPDTEDYRRMVEVVISHDPV